MLYVLKLKQTPPSFNDWDHYHWAKKSRVKENWEYEIFAAWSGNKPKWVKHISLSGKIYFKLNRKRDAENYGAVLWKIVPDALVNIGIIPDDTPDYISTQTPEIFVDKEDPRTELFLDIT